MYRGGTGECAGLSIACIDICEYLHTSTSRHKEAGAASHRALAMYVCARAQTHTYIHTYKHMYIYRERNNSSWATMMLGSVDLHISMSIPP